MTDSFAINRANWEERAAIHAAPNSYGVEDLIADPEHISAVVRFDRPRLGDVGGLRGVHLQCHIGTDTISLARLGASMVGLDFSPTALAHARALAEKTSADAEFVEANVYDAAAALGVERFDFVYVSIGALCWLPDVRRWARVVAELLKPGGRLFIRDSHPVLQSLDDAQPSETLALAYPYFERPEPMVFDDDTTYIETDARLHSATLTHQWSHGIGEIVTAVLDAGMRLTMLVEHDSAPFKALPGMRRADDGEWRLVDRPWRLPQTFTLQAVKEARMQHDKRAAVLLFSYGTLQDRAVQLANFGRELTGHADALPGYRETLVEIKDPQVVATSGKTHHPIVAPSGDPADEIAGSVFELTPDELLAADEYEVDDYARVLVRLKSGVDAWVYVSAAG